MPVNSSSYKRDSLRTVVEPAPLKRQVSYSDPVMLIGSCFTEHIGNRLKMIKFDVNLNPFGIVYNPLSMAEQLNCLLDPTGFNTNDLVFHQELWHSWKHHSRFSNPDAAQLIRTIDDQALSASRFLDRAGLLILTFGTPEAFYLKDGNRLVSNCHQLPADWFITRKPDPQELADVWIPLIDTLLGRNANLRIGLTVSPVRYFKDGPTGNQVSKSILFLLIDKLLKTFPDLFYFPSYEIFMDDLRDYRFYDADMMHPAPVGVEYVWDRFVQACIDPGVFSLMDEVRSVVKAVNHRPGTWLTDARRNFIACQMDRIAVLHLKHPFLDFSEELGLLQRGLESDQS
jgi:hypothetical protein